MHEAVLDWLQDAISVEKVTTGAMHHLLSLLYLGVTPKAHVGVFETWYAPNLLWLEPVPKQVVFIVPINHLLVVFRVN